MVFLPPSLPKALFRLTNLLGEPVEAFQSKGQERVLAEAQGLRAGEMTVLRPG